MIRGNEVFDEENDPERRIARILGISIENWRVGFGDAMKGRSEVIHTFDAILESRTEGKVITILFLRENDENKSQMLMLHRVKSNDVSASASYVLVDYALTKSEETMKDVCHIRDVRVSPPDLEMLKLAGNGDIPSEIGISEIPKEKLVVRIKSRTPMRKNRDRTKIVHDILGTIINLKKASVTQIIYRCNLNYRYAVDILKQMANKGLVDIAHYDGVGKRYRITERGSEVFGRMENHTFI